MPRGANVLSQGDIVDRLTILAIKAEHKIPGAGEQAESLRPFCLASMPDVVKMYHINLEGWEAVGYVTDHFEGHKKLPPDELIDWCHKAHVSNRERIALKNSINKLFREDEERKTWHRAA